MNRKNKFCCSLKQGNFSKSILMITGGSAFAQGLGIILSPIITRIYSPEEYGLLTVYLSFLGMISLLGALSYDSAIPIAEDDEKAFNILILCLGILFFISAILVLILFFKEDFFLTLFKTEQIKKYKYLIPVGFFLTGVYTVLTNWALRKKDYKAITVTKYSQSIIGNIAKIILGLLKFGATGLILGNVLNQSAGAITLIKSNRVEFKKLFKKVNYQDIKILSKRYIRFPLYTAPGLFILSLAGQLPTLFISTLYGASIVGLYGLARSITFLPMTIIGKSVQDVFYGEAANIGKKNPIRIKELYNKLLKKLIILGAIPSIILVILGPLLFSFIFGESWNVAGIFARIISVEVFFHFIFHPISSVFSIFEQQQKSLIITIFKLVLVLCVFGIAKSTNIESQIIILAYSVLMAMVEIITYMFAQKIMNDEIKRQQII